MIERIYSLLGIARRAGKITSGESQVEAMLKKAKAICLFWLKMRRVLIKNTHNGLKI